MTETRLSPASGPALPPARRPAQRPRRFKTARTVTALVLREMSSTYGRSPGGYIWALLDPIGGIVMLSVVFSFIIRAPALGTNFPLFYATGFLPFLMYSDLGAKLMGAIQYSRPLLAYPGVTWVDAVLGRFILNTLTQVAVFCLVSGGILILFRTGAFLDMVAILNALAMAAALGLGIGTLNCFLGEVFPVWRTIWSILNRPMFIISGVFFLYDAMPPLARDILWYNPLVHVIGEMRRGFYGTYDAPFVAPVYVYGFAGVCLVFGMIFLSRYHRDILNT
jgi:capsular polysaccharide transport system permease protein